MTNIAHEQIWCDEAYTLFASSGSIKEIVAMVGFNGTEYHPPLYHIFIGLLRMLLGDSPVLLRGFSALCGSLLIVSVYLFIRQTGNRTVALTSSLLVMANPIVVAFSQEIMMYTLATLLATVNLLSFYCIFEMKRFKLWPVYIFSALLGIYTHYYFVFTLVTTFFFVVFKWLRKDVAFKSDKKLLLRYLASQTIICVCFLPWLPAFCKQSHATALATWFEPIEYLTPLKIIIYFFTSKFSYDANPIVSCQSITSFVLFFILFGIYVRIRSGKNINFMVYAIAAFVLPILITCIISALTHSIIMFRYYILFFPFLMILFAQGLNLISNKKLSMLLCAIYLAVMAFSIMITLKDHFNGSGGDAANYLKKNTGIDEPVIVLDNASFATLYYYLGKPTNLFFYYDTLPFEPFGINICRNGYIEGDMINAIINPKNSFYNVYSPWRIYIVK
jgi:mannosyltransferase